MADATAKEQADSAVDPSEVARQKFDLERRGFDQAQVRAYLIAVADSLRDAQTREADIRKRLGKAIRRAEQADAKLRESKPEDPSSLSRQVGDEVAAVLDAARVAGEQKVSAAEKSAEQLMANAKAEATQLRQAAESIMDERKAEADAEADRILAEHKAEAAKLIETAQADADARREEGVAAVAVTRQECDAMVAEAEQARAQILQDMERRRRQARAQVERLRVGRDRLLRSHDVVRRTLDESTTELKSSLKEAKVLGDTAARTAMAEPLREPAQLEAELADSRLIGRTATPASAGPGAAPASDAESEPGPGPRSDSAKQARSGDAELPHVDMRPGAFSEETAPTPRRPVVGQKPATTQARVPKPPAVAPMIKAPDAAETPQPPSGDASGEVRSGLGIAEAKGVEVEVPGIEIALQPEVEAEGAIAVLPVPKLDIDAEDGRADDEADAVDAEATAESGVGADSDQLEVCDEDFSDLPKEDLAIIVASDEIEQVIALASEPAPETEVETEAGPEPEAAAEPEAVDAVESETEPEIGPEIEVEIGPEVEAEAASADQHCTDEEPAGGLFAALRVQAGGDENAAANKPAEAVAATVDPKPESGGDHEVDETHEADLEAELAQIVEAEAARVQAELETEASSAETEVAPVDPVGHGDGSQIVETALGPIELIDPESGPETGQAAGAGESAESGSGDPKDMARQRDAVVEAITGDITKRLKRALADEQNDVLAGLRTAGKRDVELIGLVGETDVHVQRYVVAINEVAAQAFGAGAALVDGEATEGAMPAGAVEELIGSAIVLPIRLRLIELDAIDVDRAVAHLDAIRAFYRQRKTDYLGEAAASLASLLVTAGACEALPANTVLPWMDVSQLDI